jgi:hypothetical protein
MFYQYRPQLATCFIYRFEAVLIKYRYCSSFYIVVKKLLGYFGFEYPLFKFSILRTDPPLKIKRQRGDGIFVPDIGITKAPGT